MSSYKVKPPEMLMRTKDPESSGYRELEAAKNGHVILLVLDEAHANNGTAAHVSELAKLSGLSEASVSGRLQTLKKYGLVECTKKGRWSALPAAYTEDEDPRIQPRELEPGEVLEAGNPLTRLDVDFQRESCGYHPLAAQVQFPPCPNPQEHILMVGHHGHALPVAVPGDPGLRAALLAIAGPHTTLGQIDELVAMFTPKPATLPNVINIELDETEQEYLLGQLARAQDYYRENDKSWTRREAKRASAIQKKITDASKRVT